MAEANKFIGGWRNELGPDFSGLDRSTSRDSYVGVRESA